MKFYLITDDADTCVGMRFAGVESTLVHDASEALCALERASVNENTAILFVTSGIKKLCGEKIAALSAGSRPVVVEIPDSANAGKTGGAVADYIRATVGISI